MFLTTPVLLYLPRFNELTFSDSVCYRKWDVFLVVCYNITSRRQLTQESTCSALSLSERCSIQMQVFNKGHQSSEYIFLPPLKDYFNIFFAKAACRLFVVGNRIMSPPGPSLGDVERGGRLTITKALPLLSATSSSNLSLHTPSHSWCLISRKSMNN